MRRKIIAFIALFYVLTLVTAFVMAETLDPTEVPNDEETITKEEAEITDEEIAETQETITPLEESPTQPLPEVEAPSREEKEVGSIEGNKVILERPSTGESPQAWGFTLAGGIYRPDDYKGHGTKFNTIYPSKEKFLANQGGWIDLSFEWQFLKAFGKLGAKITSGSWLITQQFDSPNDQSTSKSLYALWVWPFFAGGVYRFQYWRMQPIIPFVEGAFGSLRFQQGNAERGDRYRNIYRYAYMAGGGVQINANLFDPKAGRSFDINWGVNNTHLIAEYRFIQSTIRDNFDFTGKNLLTAGLLFEF